MSKIVNAIQAGDTGNRRASRIPLDFVTIKETAEYDNPAIQLQYRIEVKIGSQVWVDKNTVVSSVIEPEYTLAEAVKSVKRGVVEEIFGEFRQPLNKLRIAIFNGEKREALDIICQIENEMFEV